MGRAFAISPWKQEIQSETWNINEKVVLAVLFGVTWKTTVIKGVRQEVLAHRARISLRCFTRAMYVLDNLAGVVTRSKKRGRGSRKGIARGEVTTYTLHPEKLKEWSEKPRPKEWDELGEDGRPRDAPTESREHTVAVEEARRAVGAADDDPVRADLLRRARKADANTNREAAAERARQRAREKHLTRQAKFLEGLQADLAKARATAQQAAGQANARPAAEQAKPRQAEQPKRMGDSTAPGTRASDGAAGLTLADVIAQASQEDRELLATMARGVAEGHPFCANVAARVLKKAREDGDRRHLLTDPEREVLKGLPTEWAARGGPGPSRKLRSSLQPPAEPGEYDWSAMEDALQSTF